MFEQLNDQLLVKEGSRMEGTLDFDSVNLGANFLQ